MMKNKYILKKICVVLLAVLLLCNQVSVQALVAYADDTIIEDGTTPPEGEITPPEDGVTPPEDGVTPPEGILDSDAVIDSDSLMDQIAQETLESQIMTAELDVSDAVTINYQNGPRLLASGTVLKWQSADAVDGNFSDITGGTDRYYDITAADQGKYIRAVINDTEVTEPVGPIGQLIVFDLSKENTT